MLKLSKQSFQVNFYLEIIFMPHFVLFFMLPGVAFSNSSMTSFSFNSGAKRFLLALLLLFLEGKFFELLFKFKLTHTLTIFGDYGILAHIP